MEARIALAFVANRQGASVATPSHWANVMSLELGWFSPAQARQYVEAARAEGLLDGDDELRLTFDHREVEVPRGFRPTGEVPTAPERHDPFLDLVDRVAAATGQGRGAVMQAVSAVQARFGGKLSADAALVRVALDEELDVGAEAQAALARLTARA